MRCIAVVGMNGAGKTTFGKRLAGKLGMKRFDTDRAFEEKHGDHHQFIGKHGWDRYRSEEERIVLDALMPGFVVILSGGAIESSAVRSALKEHAIVIWLQAGSKRIHKHLQRAKVARPEFAAGLHRGKVDELTEARNPHYEDVADIAVAPSVPFSGQIPFALKELEKLG